VTEHYGTDWSGQVTKSERAESGYSSDERIGAWEEKLTKDQSGRSPVEKEIVPFNGGTYKSRQSHLVDRRTLSYIFPTDSVHDAAPLTLRLS
jgi:hypothetical protein